MTIRLKVVWIDGQEDLIRDYDDFAEAVDDALQLADTHGTDKGDGHGPPVRLRVYRDDKIEFSVKVMRGGLVPVQPAGVPATRERRSTSPAPPPLRLRSVRRRP